jgi:hypothetical protein
MQEREQQAELAKAQKVSASLRRELDRYDSVDFWNYLRGVFWLQRE